MEAIQKHKVTCKCGYKLENPGESPLMPKEMEEFVNKPCPECGESLCTKFELLSYYIEYYVTKTLTLIKW